MFNKVSSVIIIFFIFSGFHFINIPSVKSLYTLSGQAQGTTYSIKYIHTSPIIENNAIQHLLSEIDQSLSLYQPNSLISHFNKAKRGVEADHHFIQVVRKSLLINSITQGCFDITSKPISMLWGFNASMPQSIPSKDLVRQTLKFVGSHHLSFYRDSLVKDNPNTMIDCDGIAQGYTVDQLSMFLRNKGINDFMVE